MFERVDHIPDTLDFVTAELADCDTENTIVEATDQELGTDTFEDDSGKRYCMVAHHYRYEPFIRIAEDHVALIHLRVIRTATGIRGHETGVDEVVFMFGYSTAEGHEGEPYLVCRPSTGDGEYPISHHLAGALERLSRACTAETN